jgi:hypothetical protein
MFVAVCEMWQKSEMSDNENIISTIIILISDIEAIQGGRDYSINAEDG